MTLPIIPGPFSFLQSAGEAAGAIGEEVRKRREKLDTDARNRLTDILALVQAGAEPSAFAGTGGAALERLGLAPVGAGAAVLSGPAERAHLALETARTALRTGKAQATTAEAGANVAPGIAAAQLTEAQEAAKRAPGITEATNAASEVQTHISKLVQTELNNPETNFGKLAARAAAGVLPYYSALLSLRYQSNALARERQHELFQLFFEPLDNAASLWKERLQLWEQRRRTELFGHEDDKDFVSEWDKTNPRPALESVQQELLQSAAAARGMTVDQYNQKLNQVVGLVGEAEETAMPPGKIDALKARVGQVMSGAKTPQQVEQEITMFYRTRGGTDAPLMIQIDLGEFRRLLQEAQGAKPSGKRK